MTRQTPTLCTLPRQSPLSLGFFRQEYLSGLPFPAPRDLPAPGITAAPLKSPAWAGRLSITSTPWEARLDKGTEALLSQCQSPVTPSDGEGQNPEISWEFREELRSWGVTGEPGCCPTPLSHAMWSEGLCHQWAPAGGRKGLGHQCGRMFQEQSHMSSGGGHRQESKRPALCRSQLFLRKLHVRASLKLRVCTCQPLLCSGDARLRAATLCPEKPTVQQHVWPKPRSCGHALNATCQQQSRRALGTEGVSVTLPETRAGTDTQRRRCLGSSREKVPELRASVRSAAGTEL